MPERTAILNSGPVIALAGIGQLSLLPRLYNAIVIPEAVTKEILAGETPQTGESLFRNHPWLQRVTAIPDVPLALPLFLGRGEVEVITLAHQHPDWLIVIDDYRARRAVEALHFTATGTTGILVRAKREHLIPEVLPLLRQMRINGYYLADSLLAEAAQRTGEQLV
jgi:predicted nucleic acid-binding protein